MPGPKPTPSVYGDPHAKSFWKDERTIMLLVVVGVLFTSLVAAVIGLSVRN